MATRIPVRDVVIVLPGITGSVLEKDGREAWGSSWGALTRLAVSRAGILRTIGMSGDDPAIDDPGDGVVATRLVPGAHIVPGLVKIDGYAELTRFLTREFRVAEGTVDDPRPANFYPYPYDWRRDLRGSARRFGRFALDALHRWREHSGARDAKLLVLAHSMGGLLARYWLEVLGGWPECRALITFGTPFRGSLKALGYLANGYRPLGPATADVTAAMRSFTSIYQLLPIYPAVRVADGWRRAAEADGVPGIDADRAAEALRFHREIEQAVVARQAAHGPDVYPLVPIVGTLQQTPQSAVLSAGTLRIGPQLPAGVDPLLDDGDGTVPRAAAVPLELSKALREIPVAQRHSALHTSATVLDDLRFRLAQLQVRGLDAIRGEVPAAVTTGLDLDVPDACPADEVLLIRVRPMGAPGGSDPLPASVAATTPGGPARRVLLPWRDGCWQASVPDLPPGVYRVTAGPHYPAAPALVHDLCEVIA